MYLQQRHGYRPNRNPQRSPRGPKTFPEPEKALAFVQIKDLKIEIVKSDLCNERTDAIVNAANEHLQHAGGLARAIVVNGGRRIQIESDRYVDKHGNVETGGCCFTGAGRLPTKHVIHAVGPMWYAHRDKAKARKLLRKTIRSVYISAIKKKLSSISIPPISGGIFGYPTELCALDIVNEVFRVAKIFSGTLKLLRIVIIDIPTFQVFFRQFIKSRREYQKEISESAELIELDEKSKKSNQQSDEKSSSGEKKPMQLVKRKPIKHHSSDSETETAPIVVKKSVENRENLSSGKKSNDLRNYFGGQKPARK